MNFTITGTTEGTAYLEKGSEKFLAINSELRNKSFIGVDTSRLQSLPGLIIKEGEISNWKIEGVTEIDEKTYFYGPYLMGKTLAELELTPKVLLNLTSALHIIKDRVFPVRQFSLSALFYTDDQQFLLFPPHLMDFLNTHRKAKNSLEMIVPWNHPAWGGNKGKSFTIAALTYKTLTGEYPFPGESEEEIEIKMVKKDYKSLLLFNPLLKKEITELIDDSFAGEGSLERWRDVLNLWCSEGPERSAVSPKEQEVIIEQQIKIEKKRIHKNQLSSFFHRNRSRLTTGIIALFLIGLIIQVPLSKYLEPPATIGKSQEEVVKLYYNCFKTLDTEILEDCITSKAGKGDINEISTIYVTSKVRLSHEGSTGIVEPDQWIQDGMNPVEPGVHIWGLSGLKIKRISEYEFEASYIKWTPAVVDNVEDLSPRMPLGIKVNDILHLSLIGEAWKIDGLNRTIREL